MKGHEDGEGRVWAVLSIVLPPVLLLVPLWLLSQLNIPVGLEEWKFFCVVILVTMVSYFGVRSIRAQRKVFAQQEELMRSWTQIKDQLEQQRAPDQLAEKPESGAAGSQTDR